MKLITCTWIFLATWFIVQTTAFNKPAKFLILLKHWGYDNFELNWFHWLSKSRAIPFSQVSADSLRFNIQKCSRSLYAFIAFRPTCFAWRLVMRNLHEISTQRARWLYPDSKNNSRRITYGTGCVWGMPSLSPLTSLGLYVKMKIKQNLTNVISTKIILGSQSWQRTINSNTMLK